MGKAIVLAEYQGISISFTEEGWFEATVASEQFGKKPIDWIRLDETQSYMKALAEILKCEPKSLLKTRRGNMGGTWLHPKLAVAFGRWISPEFAVWCDLHIDGLIRDHLDWKRLRHGSSSSNKVRNEALRLVREEQGKVTASHHYSNEARLINWVLTGEFKGLDRDSLPLGDLDILMKLEVKDSVFIGRGLGYDDRKKMLEQYAIDLRPAPVALRG